MQWWWWRWERRRIRQCYYIVLTPLYYVPMLLLLPTQMDYLCKKKNTHKKVYKQRRIKIQTKLFFVAQAQVKKGGRKCLSHDHTYIICNTVMIIKKITAPYVCNKNLWKDSSFISAIIIATLVCPTTTKGGYKKKSFFPLPSSWSSLPSHRQHDHHDDRIYRSDDNSNIIIIARRQYKTWSICHHLFLECDLEEEKRWRWWNNWSRIKVAKFQSDLPLILSLCSAPQNTFILLILASSALLSSFLLLQSNQINSLQSTHLQHKCSSNNKNQIRHHGLLLPYTPLSLYTHSLKLIIFQTGSLKEKKHVQFKSFSLIYYLLSSSNNKQHNILLTISQFLITSPTQ